MSLTLEHQSSENIIADVGFHQLQAAPNFLEQQPAKGLIEAEVTSPYLFRGLLIGLAMVAPFWVLLAALLIYLI